jgi:hypothetical protein
MMLVGVFGRNSNKLSTRNTQHWDGEYEFGSPWGDGDDDDDVASDDSDDETDDDVTDVHPCPACGADVYAESDHCPICGELIEDAPLRSEQQPGWRKLIIVLLIIGLLLGMGLGMIW